MNRYGPKDTLPHLGHPLGCRCAMCAGYTEGQLAESDMRAAAEDLRASREREAELASVLENGAIALPPEEKRR